MGICEDGSPEPFWDGLEDPFHFVKLVAFFFPYDGSFHLAEDPLRCRYAYSEIHCEISDDGESPHRLNHQALSGFERPGTRLNTFSVHSHKAR